MDFLRDKRVLFAIGCAAIASICVALKWLFTGSLLSAVDTIDEGKTGSTATAVIPLVLDFACWLIIAVGTYCVSFLRTLFDGVSKATSTNQISAKMPTAVGSPDAKSLERLVLELGDAVASNDQVAEAALRKQLRLPFALDEMQRAYRDGNVALGKTLAAEIELLLESPADEPESAEQSQAPARRRGTK